MAVETRLTKESLKETAGALRDMRKNTGSSKEPREIRPINRYSNADLNSFTNKEMIDYCQRWAELPQRILAPMITGGIGTGKTHLLWALYNQLIYYHFERKQIILETATEIVYEIKNGIGLKISDEILNRYKSISFLLLDDLGAERVTEWVQEQFYLIMDYRWRYHLPTVVTSNYRLNYLADSLGERIVSRIAGMVKPFQLEGKDRRVE